jgi:hypothetical protein
MVWEKYLKSYPQGTNELYIERTEHDCQTCRSFIRKVGNVVAIKDGKLVSIWDVEAENEYGIVTDALSAYVKSFPIDRLYMYNESKIGAEKTFQDTDNGVKTWNHFNCTIPARLVNKDYQTVVGGISSTKQVFHRGLEELTEASAEIVLDLINQNSLYRGEEFKLGIESFLELKKAYSALVSDVDKDIFVWENLKERGARIRNTAIGTLLQDLSGDVDINTAVASFETKVAPSNYKRTSAPSTKRMIDGAVTFIRERGLEPALPRRFATLEDISVNNVIFADRNASSVMKDSLTDLLMSGVKTTKGNYDKVEEISIEDFLENVVPNVNSIEALVSNKHSGNFVSLIAPQNEAENILQWDNNFSWSYNGNVTDSMKERVKSAGGRVDGVLRFSIQWNEERSDQSNDLDAHCIEPDGNHIYFS